MMSGNKTEEILVSICCVTYNHEKYIREALDSFLMQKTNFAFEIVIHDDASTDKTQQIIKEYVEKYPKIFNALLQTENQRSKYKSGMNPRFNYPRAQGKYIALCEGDDYWTDPLKLQKQVDFLEANEEYSACFHNAYVENSITKEKYLYHQWKESKEIAPELAISIGGYIFPTASILFKKFDFQKINFKAPAGDLELLFNLILHGNLYFMDDVMCVYRRHEQGVYSSLLKNKMKLLEHDKKIIEYLETKFTLLPLKLHTSLRKSINEKVKNLFYKLNSPLTNLFMYSKYLTYREMAQIIKFKLKNSL